MPISIPIVSSSGATSTVSVADPTVTPVSGTRKFNGDYSTGNFNQWPSVQNRVWNGSGSGYSSAHPGTFYGATIVNDAIYGKAARYEVRSGDNPGFSPGTERSQVGSSQSQTGGTAGQILWYKGAFKFDPNFPKDHASRGFGVVSGWHPNSNTGSGPFQWNLQDRNGYVSLYVQPQSSPGTYLGSFAIWDVPLGTSWHDWKLQVQFGASASTGWLRLWYNGVRQTFKNGSTTMAVPTLVGGTTTVYYKEGYYRSSMSPTATLWTAGFRCATTESAL